MALLVPIVLVLILLVLAQRYRAREGGLSATLWRIEQSILGSLETGTAPGVSVPDRDALSEAPEHLFRLVLSAIDGGEREDRIRALAAIREYREFRGWKA